MAAAQGTMMGTRQVLIGKLYDMQIGNSFGTDPKQFLNCRVLISSAHSCGQDGQCDARGPTDACLAMNQQSIVGTVELKRGLHV